MAEVINLNKARKARARAGAAADAQTNRAMHGRTRAEKTRVETEAARRARDLEGHLREPDEDQS